MLNPIKGIERVGESGMAPNMVIARTQ